MKKIIFPIILLTLALSSCNKANDNNENQSPSDNSNAINVNIEKQNSGNREYGLRDDGISEFTGESEEINFEINENNADFSTGGWERASEEEINEGIIIEDDEKGNNSDIEN